MEAQRRSCEYCGTSEGQIEWHHPIPDWHEVGILLCQHHHSLVYGRVRFYDGDTPESVQADRKAIDELVRRKVGVAIKTWVDHLVEQDFKG